MIKATLWCKEKARDATLQFCRPGVKSPAKRWNWLETFVDWPDVSTLHSSHWQSLPSIYFFLRIIFPYIIFPLFYLLSFLDQCLARISGLFIWDQGPNLQNFVRWTYENITKKSDIRKVYENNAIFKKNLTKKVGKTYEKREKKLRISIRNS